MLGFSSVKKLENRKGLCTFAQLKKTTAAFPWELGGCMSVIIRLRRRCISIYSQLTDC